MLSHSSTGVPVVDAREDFLRARRAHVAARLVRRARVPRMLPAGADVPSGPARLEVIPLKSIVGTVEPTITFDARFRPASALVRARWERIALAHRRGVALAPIGVLQGGDGYYVVDGRHRVSVALALGRRDIEAWVTPVRAVPAWDAMHAHLPMILANERVGDMDRCAERSRHAREAPGRPRRRFGFRPSLALRLRRVHADLRAAR
jgi:hypothetical protein